VPEITDPVEAEREVELAVLSAVAHGNGPKGMAVVEAASSALVIHAALNHFRDLTEWRNT
jgi:hypothetical protein